MAKLFAMEDADLEGGAGEMEGSEEAGEASAVLTDMAPAVDDIAQADTGVSEGTDAGEQLEEVHDEVAKDVVEGTPLSEESAKYVRLAVEAISARVGYNPKKMYALYSTENFRSESSRMANTRIALEGIGQFLKDLWDRIKKAVSLVIKKVKEFYAKHISGLGRVIKAIDVCKKKVSDTKGSVKNPRIDAPSSLVSLFCATSNLSSNDVSKIIAAHKKETEKIKAGTFSQIKTFQSEVSNHLGNVTAKTGGVAGAKTTNEAQAAITALKASAKAAINGGLTSEFSLSSPAVGGVYFEFTDNDDFGYSFTSKTADIKTADDPKVSVSSLNQLTSLLSDVAIICNDNRNFAKYVEAFQKEFDATTREIDKNLAKLEESQADYQKGATPEIGKAINLVGKLSSGVAKHSVAVTSLNVKLAFGVISFVKFNLKQYSENN